MYRPGYLCRQGRGHYLAPLPAHAEVSSKKSLRCRGAEADNDFWFYHSQFGVKLPSAGVNFRGPWFLVNSSFPPLCRAPFEMLDYVGDVDVASFNACGLQSCAQQPSRRANKRMSFNVLSVTWLLAHQHDRGVRTSFAKHCLRRIFPQLASSAAGRAPAKSTQRSTLGGKLAGATFVSDRCHNTALNHLVPDGRRL